MSVIYLFIFLNLKINFYISEFKNQFLNFTFVLMKETDLKFLLRPGGMYYPLIL